MSASPTVGTHPVRYGVRIAAVFKREESKRDFVQELMQRIPMETYTPMVARARALGVPGYVSKGRTLLSGFTVRDNVYMSLEFRLPRAAQEMRKRTHLLCRFCGIDVSLLEQDATGLSELEKIQATFLQAIVGEPDLMVCDAIFEGLAPAQQACAAKLTAGYRSLYPLRSVLYLGYARPASELFAVSDVWSDEPK